MRRPLAVLAVSAAVAAATGLFGSPTASAGGGCGDDVTFETGSTTVTVAHACFSPTVTQVPVGTTVSFVNESGLEHNLTGPGPIGFNNFSTDATVKLTFSTAGIFPYACTFHPGMSGAVVVGNPLPGPASPAAAPATSAAAIQLSAADEDGSPLGSTPVVVGTGAVVAGALGAGGMLVVRRRRTALPSA
jgi:plastocyanin